MLVLPYFEFEGDDNKKLIFKKEVKNIEFFELIGDMNLNVYTHPEMREKSLLKIGKKLLKNHTWKNNKIFRKKIEREIEVLSQDEIDMLLTSIIEDKVEVLSQEEIDALLTSTDENKKSPS
jgi:flagellar biosynthesis regulator FlbT